MIRTVLKSKIHRATVTAANIAYEGSITIDAVLLEAANILPYEMVHVLDIDNGERLITYAIEGEENSGRVEINGAAARKITKGDCVIIAAYAQMNDDTLEDFTPHIVKVNAKNQQRSGTRS